MTKKAIINFSPLSDPGFIDRIYVILKSMDNNPDYRDPVPTLEEVRQASDAFYEALLAVKQGAGKQATAIKNDRRAALEELARRLGTYVNLTANGDLAMLDGSGFEISKDRTHVGILPAPASFTLAAVLPGQIDISIEKVDRATGYFVQYRKEGETAHQELLFTKTKGTLQHLDSVTRYFVRIGTVSTGATDAQQFNFTEEKSVVVQ